MMTGTLSDISKIKKTKSMYSCLGLALVEIIGVTLFWVLYIRLGKNEAYYNIDQHGIFPQHFNLGGSVHDLWIFSLARSIGLLVLIAVMSCTLSFRKYRIRISFGIFNYMYILYILFKLLSRLLYEPGNMEPPNTIFWFFVIFSILYTLVLNFLFGKIFKGLEKQAKIKNEKNKDENTPLLASEKKDFEEESAEEESKRQHASIKALFKLAAPDWSLYLWAFLFLMIAATAQAFIPKFTGQMVDVAEKGDMTVFSHYAGLLCFAAAICAFFTGLRGGIFMLCIARLNVRLRETLLKSLVSQEPGFYDTAKIGDVTSRLNTDTTKVADTIGLNVNVFLRSIVQSLGVLVFMFLVSWELTLVTFISIPVVLIMTKIFGRVYRKISEGTQQKLGDANSIAQEVLSSIPTVRAFAGQEAELDIYSFELKKFYIYSKKRAILYCFYAMFVTVLPNLVTALVLFYGGKLVIIGRLKSGDLFSFMLYQQNLSAAFSTVADVFTGISEALGAADKVFLLSNRIPKERPAGSLVLPHTDFKGEIHLKDVTFSYPARPDIVVMKNFDLKIKPGEVVALVGPSGGGKSSIVKLIERLYEPNEGDIYLDGRLLSDFDPEFLHRKISIVSQEPVLFARSIENNILYGLTYPNEPEFRNKHLLMSLLKGDLMKVSNHDRTSVNKDESTAQYDSCLKDVTEEDLDQIEQDKKKHSYFHSDYSREDIINAAKLANAHDFIMAMPNGYDTEVGEKGVQLSGGQKQRIAIARALVRKPDILLLDEATSALDTESEAIVQGAIDQIMKQKLCTVIVIAHRLSTVKNADRIVVIQKGTVVEMGDHNELVEKGGVYSSLVHRQLTKPTEKKP